MSAASARESGGALRGGQGRNGTAGVARRHATTDRPLAGAVRVGLGKLMLIRDSIVMSS